jgi:hypothetical protein
MPNWCENDLYVRGPKEDVEQFLEHARGDEGDFDFNKFIPMPRELFETQAGSLGEIGYDAFYGDCSRVLNYPWVREAGVRTRQELQEFLRSKDPAYEEMARRYRDNIERFGFPNWYDWAISNWGTKWNARKPIVSEVGGGVLMRFSTAWSPPRPVVLKASEVFPRLTFRLKYFEGGACFQGVLVCQAGVVLVDDVFDYNGERGG